MSSRRLIVGDAAPTFSLELDTGDMVSLADFAGSRVLVYFYPAALTPGCTNQAVDFQDALAGLKQLNIAVVGISPDSPEKLSRFRAQHKLTFPLLSDPDKTVLSQWGAFGEKKLYGKTVTGVIRSTFLVEVDGSIGIALYNVRAKGHVAKLHRDLGLENAI